MADTPSSSVCSYANPLYHRNPGRNREARHGASISVSFATLARRSRAKRASAWRSLPACPARDQIPSAISSRNS
jgi:hypothetical protein